MFGYIKSIFAGSQLTFEVSNDIATTKEHTAGELEPGYITMLVASPDGGEELLTRKVADVIWFCVFITTQNPEFKQFDDSEDILREAFSTLLDCANMLAEPGHSAAARYKAMIRCLQALRPEFQHALCTLLGVLVGCNEWPTWDTAAVANEDFEISAIVWALKVGPIGMARGFTHCKTALEILVFAEEKWLADHMDDKAALEVFAEDLRAWGKGVLAGQCEL